MMGVAQEGQDRAVRDGVVLLLEDSELDRYLVFKALRDAYEVETVGLLSGALDRLAARPFDAVLTDLNLPDARGPGIVAKLAAAAPRTPVIVLTVHEDMAEVCHRAGAQDYLNKDELTARNLQRTLGYAVLRQHARELEMRLAVCERRAAVAESAAGTAREIRDRADLILEDLALVLARGALAPRAAGERLQGCLNQIRQIASKARDLLGD